MKISILYNYVFDQHAKIDKSAFGKYQIESEKKSRAAIQKQFKLITTDPNLSSYFQQILRAVHATDLENHLYGDETSNLLKQLSFPSDEMIVEQFLLLDQRYKFFTGNEEAKNEFIALFKGAKLIADFVEKNNTADDQVAYEHAYKLLVYFGTEKNKPFAKIERFIKRQAQHLKNPIHDLLVFDLPVNDPPISLARWQKLITQSGSRQLAFSLFQRAAKIEELLGKAPQSMKQIQEAASKLSYSRTHENPDFAQLCLQYNLPEKVFNFCLDLKPKTFDTLPKINIDGSEFGHPGYHLVRVPFKDLRALILGHITHCCQSIGGASEASVINGFTGQNSGFIVLLKQKTKLTNQTPFTAKGEIDYAHFDIVVASLFWRSDLDNITFDSSEGGKQYDQVIYDLLRIYAKKITEEHPDILRVTIGSGGRTPLLFSDNNPILEIPERIKEGEQYPDSYQQRLVFLDEERAKKIEDQLKEKLKQFVNAEFNVSIISTQQNDMIEALLTEENKNKFGDQYHSLVTSALHSVSQLKIYSYLNALNLLDIQNISLLEGKDYLVDPFSHLFKHAKQLINEKSIQIIVTTIKEKTAAFHFFTLLSVLPTNAIEEVIFSILPSPCQKLYNKLLAFHTYKGFLAIENIRLLQENQQFLEEKSLLLQQMYFSNPAWINDETRKIIKEYNSALQFKIACTLFLSSKRSNQLSTKSLLQIGQLNSEKPEEFDSTFTLIFQRLPDAQITDEHVGFIIKNLNKLVTIGNLFIASTLVDMVFSNSLGKLNKDRMLTALLDFYKQSNDFHSEICYIEQAWHEIQNRSLLITDDYFEAIVKASPRSTEFLNTILVPFHGFNPTLITQENIQWISQRDLINFFNQYNELFTEKNFILLKKCDMNQLTTLFESWENLPITILGIEIFSTVKVKGTIDTPKNFSLLLEHIDHADELIKAWLDLATRSNCDIKEDEFEQVAKNAEQASSIVEAILAKQEVILESPGTLGLFGTNATNKIPINMPLNWANPRL